MRASLILIVGILSFSTRSATVDVKDVNADGEDTTIEIHKGKKTEAPRQEKTIEQSENPKTGSKWVTESDSVDITGDIGQTKSDAEKSWSKECKKWKSEFRDENKDSKIINLNCGEASCSGEAGHKKCVSKAVYKIKTKED